MKSAPSCVFASLCLLVSSSPWAATGSDPRPEVKEKPPLYTFVSNFSVPRARWADMEKQSGPAAKILEKALSDGTIVAYGDDLTLVHTADGPTHDRFWSAHSMSGLLKVLDAIHNAGAATTPVLASATKHWDMVLVSRYYGWRPGTLHNAYTHVADYKLKQDAPDDAVATLSKAFIVPLLEKLLADGSIDEYEIDVQTIHTDAPGTFSVVYIAQNPEGIDKVSAALAESVGSNALAAPALGSMVDFTTHRDELDRTNAVYK